MPASDAVPKAVAKVGKPGTSADYARGDHQHSLDPNLFPQPLNIQKNAADVGSREGLNFQEGTNIVLTIQEEAGQERNNVLVATTDQIKMQFEQVDTLPTAIKGKVVYLNSDGHVYVGIP